MSTSLEQVFLDRLAQIDRVIEAICRRKCCFGEEAEDFASFVKLKLIEDDYAVLRKFEGRSRLSTYLTTVIHNLFRDFRIQRWGKWRPSAAARRLGPMAVRLEILMSRDRFSFDEAFEILRSRLGGSVSRDEMERVATRLPSRSERRLEGEEALRDVSAEADVEDRLLDRERRARHRRTESLLARALDDLDGEDRRLLRFRFQEGFKVSEIARTLGVPPRPLYHRFEKSLARLRRSLEEEGISWRDVRDLVGWEGSELSSVFGGRRNPPSGSVPPRGPV